MLLPLFHLVRFARRERVESRCLVGSDPQLGGNRQARRTGRADAWQRGMLWPRGLPTEHLWKHKTQIVRVG